MLRQRAHCRCTTPGAETDLGVLHIDQSKMRLIKVCTSRDRDVFDQSLSMILINSDDTMNKSMIQTKFLRYYIFL